MKRRYCDFCGQEMTTIIKIPTGEHICYKCNLDLQEAEDMKRNRIDLDLPREGVWFIGRFTYMDMKNDRIHLELRENVKPLIDVHKDYLIIIREKDYKKEREE